MYEYYCEYCDLTFHCDDRYDEVCCIRCDRMARRRWGFHVLPSVAGSFNPTTGTYIRSRADLRSQLDQASETASSPRHIWDGYGNRHEVTPPEHHYVPVDLRDREALGVTSEGLDATYDALRRDGNDPAADRLRKHID